MVGIVFQVDFDIDSVEPVGVCVLIDPDPVETMTESGFHLPETINPHENARGQIGTVLKVGSRYNEETGDDLLPGDRIVYMPIGIKTLAIDNRELVISTSISYPRTILAKLDS